MKEEETMKAYKLTINAYDYWKNCDCGGYVTEEKYFTTKEKAEAWVAENPTYAHRNFNGGHTADNEYELPTFKITEIVIE